MVFGPEPWSTRGGQSWSHWDLWFCVEAARSPDGGFGAIEAKLLEKLHDRLGGRMNAESMLSHLWDLRTRLETAGISPKKLVGAAASDKKVMDKAHRKVATPSLEGRAMTEPMRETPRVQLQRRARYGSWDRFPVSPREFYEKFRGTVEARHHITKGRTFAKTQWLEDRLKALDGPRRTLPARVALHRAFHTAGLELQDRADDSYGNIGMLREDAWRTYVRLDWRSAGVEPAVWWRDLCELIVWEDYGLDYKHEIKPYASADRDDVALIESILLQLAEELGSVFLEYQAADAREEIAWLHVTKRNLTRYVDIASMLGSDAWAPIEAMARSALRAHRREIAIAVFEAANQPGFHQGTLRRMCHELTGVSLGDEDLPPRARLRVVSTGAKK